MKPSAYMPYFGNDFEAATKGLSVVTKWAYLCALWHYWHHTHCKGIPNNDDRLRGICEVDASQWPEVKAEIFGQYFRLDASGLWQQERSLEIYHETVEAYRRRVEGAEKARKLRKAKSDSNSDINVDINSDINAEISSDSNVDIKVQPESESESESNSDSLSLAVELPPGFPKSAEEAISQHMGTIPHEFIRTTWHRAKYRGGKDHNGCPILSWPHYLSACHSMEQGRKAEQQQKGSNGTHRSNSQPHIKDRNEGTYNAGRGKEYEDLVVRKQAARMAESQRSSAGNDAGGSGTVSQ